MKKRETAILRALDVKELQRLRTKQKRILAKVKRSKTDAERERWQKELDDLNRKLIGAGNYETR